MRRTSRARMRSLMRCCSRCRVAAARLWLLTPVQWVMSPCSVSSVARREARGATTDGTIRGDPGRRHQLPLDPDARRPPPERGGGRVGVAPASPQFAAVRVAQVSDESDVARRRRRTARGVPTAMPTSEAADRDRRRPGGHRRGPPAGRRGPGRGRRHQPRDGAVRAGRHPPVGRAARPAAAALAIDAVACLVDGLGDRLGAEAATMRDALPTSASPSSRSRAAAASRRAARPDRTGPHERGSAGGGTGRSARRRPGRCAP